MEPLKPSVRARAMPRPARATAAPCNRARSPPRRPQHKQRQPSPLLILLAALRPSVGAELAPALAEHVAVEAEPSHGVIHQHAHHEGVVAQRAEPRDARRPSGTSSLRGPSWKWGRASRWGRARTMHTISPRKPTGYRGTKAVYRSQVSARGQAPRTVRAYQG